MGGRAQWWEGVRSDFWARVMFLDWASKTLCHLPFWRRTVNSHQLTPSAQGYSVHQPQACMSLLLQLTCGPPRHPAPSGQSEEDGQQPGIPAALLGGLAFLPLSSSSGPAPDTSWQGQREGAPGGAVAFPSLPGTRSLQPQDVLSHHLKLAPGWTAAEATAGPQGLGGMCGNCCSREKHFPCSLRTAFVCLCSDTNLFNCLGMIGFSPWNWKTQPLRDRGREKRLAFISCCSAWTKDIEIRQRKRKVSVLPIKGLIMHRCSTGMGEAWGREGAVKWQDHRYITPCGNLSTSLLNTLANRAGVVFPLCVFLAGCIVRNI